MTKSINYLSRSVYVLYILVLIFPCTEIALRLLGYRPFYQQVFHIESKPENCIIPHSKLGFALHPGQFDVNINHGLNYHVSHGNDSLRMVTNPQNKSLKKDSTYIFGCSYTYGMGIDDSLAMPFLIQQNNTNTYVRSFAVPGYGTIQSYLQIKELVQTGATPNTIIINYADFHDDRNALTPAYRRDLFMGYQASHPSIRSSMEQANVPFISQKEGVYQLAFCEWNSIYDNWKYRTTFASINFIQDWIDRHKSRVIDKKAISLYLFKEINKICAENNIQLLVTGITATEDTRSMLDELHHLGIPTLDIAVDLSSSSFTNAPYDDHPNAKAHAYYADKITEYLSVSAK